MATNTDNVIMLFKGDDTGGSFGRTVSFVISVEAGASMDGCRAEFEYAGIVKEIAPPIVDGETRTIEYNAEETAKMPLGAGRGVLRVIDAGGKVRTATNTLPVMVTDCVPLAYPGESVISVTFKAADYDSLSGKPQINGHELTGNKSAADLGLAPAGNYATKADATLTERGFTEWVCSVQGVTPVWGDSWSFWGGIAGWVLNGDQGSCKPKGGFDSLSVEWAIGEQTFDISGVTATRTALQGYKLGSQTDKPLASEAEAEALRTAVAAKQDELSAQQLANIAAVPDKLDKSGGTMTGELKIRDSAGFEWRFGASASSAPCIEVYQGGILFGRYYPSEGTGNLALKESIGLVAYVNGESYMSDSLVVKDGGVYRCTASPASTESWVASEWEKLFDLDTGAPASGGTKLITNGQAFTALQGKADVSAIPYDLGTPTIIDTAFSETVEGETVYYGAATLANRTANIVQVTAATALDELRITFPAATNGKVRDFGLRVEIGTGSAALTAPALVPIAPTGETIKIENNAAEIPALADGTATAKGVTLLYFSETAPGVFVVKGEQVEEVA